MNPPSDSLINMEQAITGVGEPSMADTSTAASSKEWPRPRDAEAAKRAGDWVKEKATKRHQKLVEEAKEGVGLELVDRARGYEGGVQIQGLYMDGFSDLAVWMQDEVSRPNSRNYL